MFTVEGTRDGGVPYALVVGADNPDLGVVRGSEHVATLLDLADGQPFSLAPTGPTVRLDVKDEWLVLEWLQAHTSVTALDGDLPTPPEELALPEDAVV